MKYIPPEDDSMDGVNFHTIFSIQKNPFNGKYSARFKPEVKTVMGEMAEMLYYRSRSILQHFLNYSVLPTLEPELCGELSGKLFDVCLHDMVGQDEVDYTVLGFSALKSDTKNILIPDLYAMQNYFGALDEPDPFEFKNKIDNFFFIGNYTGDGRPLVNKRAQFCRWAVDKPWCHAFLSEIQQIPEQTFFEADPGYSDYTHAPLEKKYQKAYRHLVSIDGNTAAWDRPVWIMNSNSVLWKQESDHVCWWSHLCQENTHYVGFKNPVDIEDKWKSMSENQFLILNQNSKKFVKDTLVTDGHVKRFAQVLNYSD